MPELPRQSYSRWPYAVWAFAAGINVPFMFTGRHVLLHVAAIALNAACALFTAWGRRRARRRERERLRQIAEAYEREMAAVPPLWEFRPTPEEAELWRRQHPELN